MAANREAEKDRRKVEDIVMVEYVMGALLIGLFTALVIKALSKLFE